jgi:predicted PurR-regulated permease PerM
MDVVTNRLLKDATPLFTVFATVMLILGLGALLYLGRDVLIPFALALLLSFALSPVVRALRRVGASRGVAVACAVFIALLATGAIGYVVASQFGNLAGDLPKYQSTLHEKIQRLQASLASSGPFSRAGAMIGELAGDLQKIGQTGGPAPQPVAVVNRPDRLAFANEYIAPLFSPLASFVLVLLFTAFMLAQREDIRNRLIRLMGAEDLQQTTAALDDVGRRLARMLLTQLAINTVFAAAIGVGLMLIGLPSPFLWGVLAGVLRFVPYVGALIGGVLPTLLAFAVDPDWSSALWTAGLFLVLEPIFGQVIEPLLFGKSSGLSPLAVLVSATLWAFLWGPVGLVLSTPLTIVLVVLGHHVSRLEFLDVLFGDAPPLAPHEVFYQRMLAADPTEATLQAREFLRERPLAAYFDEVALPALRRAHLDIVRGLVAGERLTALLATLDALFRDLRAFGREGGRARTTGRALVLYSDDPLDAGAAEMLAQALRRRFASVERLSMLDDARLREAEAAGADVVCLCFFEPLSAQHMRAAARAARRRAPEATIVLCVWQEAGAGQIADLRRKLRVERIATTVTGADRLAETVAAPGGEARAGASGVRPASSAA